MLERKADRTAPHSQGLQSGQEEPRETQPESQTRLTERREIKGRTLRHQVQAQTLDRDDIKGRIFRSHDTL